MSHRESPDSVCQENAQGLKCLERGSLETILESGKENVVTDTILNRSFRKQERSLEIIEIN